MPKVRCEACELVFSDVGVWYPAFSLSGRADSSLFSKERVVSLSELKELRKLVMGRGSRTATIMPGAAIGTVQAKLPKRKSDFFWCGGKPLIARSAFETLAKAGVELIAGPVVAIDSGEPTNYLALQIPACAIYSDAETKRLTLVHCDQCGSWDLKNIRTNLMLPREYVASRMPKGAYLVKAAEGGETVAL